MKKSSAFLVIPVVLALAGCAGTAQMKKTPDPVDEYLALCHRLATEKTVAPGSAAEKAALERFETFFSGMSEASVREKTPQTYAKDVFFNDTLKTVKGEAALEEYFIETVKNLDDIQVTTLDVTSSHGNYYVRWVMETKMKKLNRGNVTRTIGITHLRFDTEGKIVLHQDYWDSARGVFEHVPLVGGAIGLIKKQL